MSTSEAGQGQGEAAPVIEDQIARPQRVAGDAFATAETPFTKDSRQFGEILLRVDHGASVELTPAERLKFIRDAYRYAVLYGRIDILKDQLDKLGKEIKKTTGAHPGLRGIESERLDVSVTDVPLTEITPDVVVVRKAAGAAFPQFGTEHVVLDFTVPEEPQQSGKVVTGEGIEHMLRLALSFEGVDSDTIEKNLKAARTMKVTDREELFKAANEGVIPTSALHAIRSSRIDVNALHPVKTKRTRKKTQ